MSPRPLAATASLMLPLLLVLAACSSSSSQPSPSAAATTPAASHSPAASTAAASPTPEPFSGSLNPVDKPGPPAPPTALLTNVIPEKHNGFDRITFQFNTRLPGYHVAYVQPPIKKSPSDLPVQISGNAFLQVHFDAAAGHDPNTGSQTYSGPLDITPNLPAVLQFVETEDFEGVLVWVIGLPQQLPFRVVDSTNPLQVSVDIAQP